MKKGKKINNEKMYEIILKRYIGKRMHFETKDGSFEGIVSGFFWMGAAFIELENPMCFFNTHTIIYGREIIEALE